MLTKDLLRVSRAGGDYRPQFAGTFVNVTVSLLVGAIVAAILDAGGVSRLG